MRPPQLHLNSQVADDASDAVVVWWTGGQVARLARSEGLVARRGEVSEAKGRTSTLLLTRAVASFGALCYLAYPNIAV